MPRESLTLLVLLIVALAASGTAALVHGTDELSALGALSEASIAFESSGEVGLFETSGFDGKLTSKRVEGESGRAVNARAWRMPMVRSGDPRVIKCVE